MPDALSDLETGEDTAVRDRVGGTSRWQRVVGMLGLVVVLWVGSELYDVIFFDGTFRGGPQQGPVENNDPDGDRTPPTSGGHDPSQFGH
jgi:hypothetical protein